MAAEEQQEQVLEKRFYGLSEEIIRLLTDKDFSTISLVSNGVNTLALSKDGEWKITNLNEESISNLKEPSLNDLLKWYALISTDQEYLSILALEEREYSYSYSPLEEDIKTHLLEKMNRWAKAQSEYVQNNKVRLLQGLINAMEIAVQKLSENSQL